MLGSLGPLLGLLGELKSYFHTILQPGGRMMEEKADIFKAMCVWVGLPN